MLQTEVITVLNPWKGVAYFILTQVRDIDKRELVEEVIGPGKDSIRKGPLERPVSSFSLWGENNWHLKSSLPSSHLWFRSHFVSKCYKFYLFNEYSIFSVLPQALDWSRLPLLQKDTITTYLSCLTSWAPNCPTISLISCQNCVISIIV